MLHQSSDRRNLSIASPAPWHIWHPKCTQEQDTSARWIGGHWVSRFTNAYIIRHVFPFASKICCTNIKQRPFSTHGHEKLEKEIIKAQPAYPVTQPPVSGTCMAAIQHLLEKDRSKRIGAIDFESFISDPFFRPIDFEALVAKELQPIFVPSSDKTNFDATYDLEELLLEEAPLEARARRQKPRAELKDDATEKEIRTDELHRMIETLFEPFDYTTVRYTSSSQHRLCLD